MDEDPLRPPTHPPIALTIAGSDSGGGAGIQADLKTFSALGVYGASVVTALTAQNTRTVRAVHEAPPAFVAEQIACVLEDLDVAAIKIGMLASVPIIESVHAALRAYPQIPVVLDPVMVAKSGDALLDEDASGALLALLCPRALVLTPNVPEAAVLLGVEPAATERELAAQGRALRERFGGAVLMKGGHLPGGECVDTLISDGAPRRHAYPRVDTRNTHGTGCTLSSAIAAGLAGGRALPEAVALAERYLHAAIARADALAVGHGHGPVHHFHALWPVEA